MLQFPYEDRNYRWWTRLAEGSESRPMKIAIIGGGFTGLTAAYTLSQEGHRVTVFERDTHLGGLAYGFRANNWQWHLEAAYHHLFTNDYAIIGLIERLGLKDKLIIKRPITANLYKGKIYQFDSPTHLLRFPFLSMPDKLRTGMLAAFCKIYPFWQTLEGTTAKKFAIALGGKEGWNTIWEPLMHAKFGDFAESVAASWLWARIHKRTPSLAYIDGGFQTVVNALAASIKKHGGIIHTDTPVPALTEKKTIGNERFDRILLTTPTPIAYKLLPQIQQDAPMTIPHLHAQVLILETKEPILKDTYWLSITDAKFPFLAVVQHTNFMDKRHYGGNHITYIGNYLAPDHPYLKQTKEQLLKKFTPYLKKLNLHLNSKFLILNSYMFVGPYAQPVHQTHYSQKAPPLETTISGVYLANMDSIFPWDRGTNYAVELGLRAASTILSSSK
jgi:protoporphyrinogen oxidase